MNLNYNKQLNESVRLMKDEIVNILADLNPTVYLFGSITFGDFREGWSDIDILVLTQGEMNAEQAEKLVGLRQNLAERHHGNPYFRMAEGVIMPFSPAVSAENTHIVYWGTSGQRIVDKFKIGAIEVKSLHQKGILLHGKDVRAEIPEPSYSELRDEVIRHYETIRKYAQKTDRNLYSFGWLLDIARCIYTLRTGEIIAKTAAGEWALKENLCPVSDALQKTLLIRKEPKTYKNSEEIFDYAESLGGDIQKFADVLENEIIKSNPENGGK